MLNFEDFKNTKKTRDLFEQVSCSRCGGCGQYSYCERFGTMCFKCEGTGKQLTNKGTKQYNQYKESLSIKAEDIKIGMKFFDFGAWKTVINFLPYEERLTSATTSIKMEDRVTIQTKSGTFITDKTDMLRIAHTTEERYKIYCQVVK